MRITGGTWRGRILLSPQDPRARPTTEKVREAWMSILKGRLGGATCVDLFAGTGAVGLDALSRGAASCDFVELHQRNLTLLGQNVAALDVEADPRPTPHAPRTAEDAPRTRIFRADALRYAARLEPLAYDIAFADPPYTTGHASRIADIFRHKRFARILGVEHDKSEDVGEGDHRKYGTTILTFLEAE